jgi:hypothetical protein
VEKNWVESSKITALLEELEGLRSSGSKSILFSQWTAFLDLLQIPLSRNNFSFVRLDGTLSQQQREKVLKEFSEDGSILVGAVALHCNVQYLYFLVSKLKLKSLLFNCWIGTVDVSKSWWRWDKSNSCVQCFCHGMEYL